MTGSTVRASDAPKALKGRSARRAWASEFNRVLRATGDYQAARTAAADLAMAAIDCDAKAEAHAKRSDGRAPPFTLSQAATRRSRNVDGAGDRVRDAIARDEAFPFTAADKPPRQGVTMNQHANVTSDRSMQAVPRQGGPKGDRLGCVGPGTLRPDVGQLVRRSGQPQYCGAMAGIATAVVKSGDARTSTRFIGDCLAILQNGQALQVAEFYLPAAPTRIIEASLAHSGDGVWFSFEIWCEPDPEGAPRSKLGYSYVTYNRLGRASNDRVLALAYNGEVVEYSKAPSPGSRS